MDALQEAAERCQDPVWALARRGFVVYEDGVELYVHGASSHDVAEQMTIEVLAEVLGPASRKALGAVEGLVPAALEVARRRLTAHAVRAGRVTSLVSASEKAQRPAEVENLDALLAEGRTPDAGEVPYDASDEAWRRAALGCCAALEKAADARTQTLIDLLWRKGQTPKQIADHFTCGVAAVLAHEGRLRRQLARDLRRALPDHPAGPATQDALLADACFTAAPPPVTRARIRRDTLRRTFQEEPPSYGARLAWGLGISAVAAAAWALMFFGVLPGPEDDTYPEPTVEVDCKGACTPGAQARISVLAPRDASRVALWVAGGPGEPPAPLLVGPGGGTFRLPLGAGTKLVPLPYEGQWPEQARTSTVVAVFSGWHLSGEEATQIAAGRAAEPGVITKTVTLP